MTRVSKRMRAMGAMMFLVLTYAITTGCGAASGTQQSTSDASSRHVVSTPQSFTFPSVAVGGSSPGSVAIQNTGSANILLQSYTLSDTTDFAVTNWPGSFTLSPGATLPLNLTFTPHAATSYSASLSIATNGSNPVVTLRGTGLTSTTPVPVNVSVSPTSATVQVGSTQPFTASVSGATNTAVTWSVNGVTGGNATYGTISSAGLYTAPASVPSGGSATVVATSAVDSTATASATVTITTSTSTGGNTYYVSPTGSDLSVGSAMSPWATIQHAANMVKAGDTVIVEDGTYSSSSAATVTLSTNGTSSAPIVFKSQNKWGAKIQNPNNTTQWGFTVNAAYNTIEGFDISGMNNNNGGNDTEGVELNGGANYAKVLHNHIHNIGNTNTSVPYGQNGIIVYGPSHVTIDGNNIHDVGRTANIYYVDDHGIYMDKGDYTTIQNNIIYNNPHGYNIQVYPNAQTGTQIINNVLDITGSTHVGGNVVLGNQCTSCVISNNIFFGNTSQAWFDTSCCYNTGSTITVNYNLGVSSTYTSASSAGISFSHNQTGVSSSIIFTGGSNPSGWTGSYSSSDRNSDYMLAAGSPAIDAGTSANAPSIDFLGYPRPQGNGYDIGGFEYPQ